MDLVLGLSITSEAVRWVLVEGTTGEGDTAGRGVFDLTTAVDPDELLDVLLVHEPEDRLHAIGVTWTSAAEDTATGLLEALTARGYGDVIAVSDLEAGDVLAAGIAALTKYESIAVCIVEPDAAVIARVDSDRVSSDRIDRTTALPDAVLATLDLADWQPVAIFVIGSAPDLDELTAALHEATELPVISSADAELALPRGAALASAQAVNTLARGGFRVPPRTAALVGVISAAAVALVASLSAAVGLGFPSGGGEEVPEVTDVAAEEPPAPPSPTQTVTKARLIASLAEARPVVAQTMVVAAPPAPAYVPPAYEPPAAPVPEAPAAAPAPPPAAVPPPAPVYVPPPKPRLRDRIIEKIPIINRFHTPQYQYGP